MGGEWLHTLDGEGMTPLDWAYKSGHPVVAEMMLRREKRDQSEALGGSSPLHRAAYLGLSQAVRSLITYGANEDAVDEDGETPMHKAVREGHLATAEVLVRIGDVNALSNEGMTPLHWACLTGREEIVALLLAHGADQRMTSDMLDQLTPADMAHIMSHEEVMACLDQTSTYV